MKKTFYLAAAAALLMASTTAQAGNGFSFEINGQKIRIESPRNCNSLSCLSVTNNGSAINLKNLNLNGKKSDDDDDVASNAPPARPAPVPTTPAPAVQAPAPAPVANNAPPVPPAPSVASNVPPAPPAAEERVTGLPSINEPSRAATTAPANPAPVANTTPPTPPAPPPVPQQAAAVPPAAAPTTPLGLWQTEDNKGNVRIEQCGANLCGYADKTNERILINMKPSGSKWEGRIHDPDSGSNYDSTIAMKGPNLLKVQGCAFGGLFCGGQTWKRIS
ncbi:MAG TPA: DUF2147 domain-containing protein [Bradyrhizobium sp.]|uniref:DUF2147 domain-containing protein n=1 Tax=Bradyrhizobium sp. TaxID=376 RepID=UPI002BCEC45A|nr:DUF2147 domain-containing protein [Bradyrhizobium sp.]HLZ02207.1 DUF2147 domain-containing protein [Bradyrhizobium sp.]